MNLSKLGLAVALSCAAAGASAANVGVFGSYPDASYVNGGLSGFGHTVTNIGTLDAGSLAGLNAVVLGRSVTGNAALATFVSSGGTLITEWSSTQYGMSLLGGSTSDNYSSYVTSDPIVFTAAGLLAGLDAGLGTFFSDGGATEFFQDFNSLGSGTVYGNRTAYVGAAAIVGGAYGIGWVWANGYDWGDSGGTPTFQLISNELNASPNNNVPEPGGFALVSLALLCVGLIRRRA